MKEFTIKGSYIEESTGGGRHKVFIVENDMDRDKSDGASAYSDITGSKVLIDGLPYTVKAIRDCKRGQHALAFEKGALIGLEVM